jgi:predicted glycosyltransferase
VRIWFDISNSPHINIFKALIRELESEHEVVITTRPLANTVELLELHRFRFEVIGKHYGASTARKALGYPVRIWQLYRYLKARRPDVAISHSSFHSPVVARLLGIPSLYMNDNEHTLGNVPSFVCATKVLIPECMDVAAARRQGAKAHKIIRYPGVKEGLYLWNMDLRQLERGANSQPRVFVRPEPWTALYYNGAVGFLDDLLLELREAVDVVLLPRTAEQARRYKEKPFAGVTVLEKPLSLEEIAPTCDLFIGAGGTMTREMAVLGVPTISVYQAELLEVDRYLIAQGNMTHEPRLTAARALARLGAVQRRAPSRNLLERGRAAWQLMKDTLLALGPRMRAA